MFPMTTTTTTTNNADNEQISILKTQFSLQTQLWNLGKLNQII